MISTKLRQQTDEEEGGKKKAHIDSVSKARLRSLSPGALLNLKEGLYRQLKEREWIFNRAENNLIFLVHKEGAYGVVVRNEDIDWKKYREA